MGLLWCSVSQAGVKPTRIVEPLDVSDNSTTGMVSGSEHGAMDEFILERAEKRLRHGVVPADPGTSDRGPQVVPVEKGAEFVRGVLTAAVGMENAPSADPAGGERHRQRVNDQARLHIFGQRPADDFLAVAVDDRGQIEPTLPGRNVGDIANEFGAGRGGGEVTPDQIRGGGAAGSATVVRRQGLGWQATSPSRRISALTSSGETGTPRRASAAWTRR